MRKLTISQQLILGFATVLLLMLLFGGIQAMRMRQVFAESKELSTFHLPVMASANEVENAQRNAGYQIVGYSFNRLDDWLKQGRSQLALADKAIAQIAATAERDPLLAERVKGHLAVLRVQQVEFKKQVDRTEKIVLEIKQQQVRALERADVLLSEVREYRKAQSDSMIDQIRKADKADELLLRFDRIGAADAVLSDFTEVRLNFWRLQQAADTELIGKTHALSTRVLAGIDELLKVTRQEKNKRQLNDAKQAGTSFKECIDRYSQLAEELEQAKQIQLKAYTSMLAAAANLGVDARTVAVETADKTAAIMSQNLWITYVGVGAAVAIGLTLAWIITTGLTRVLKQLIERLHAGANQTSAAASQVSKASQELASGASEQAASLEETSASLEELSSMTRQNAESADQANVAMKETALRIDAAADAMREMNEAIVRIQASTEETAKILKTVDEIAFQTNILALNAAVEAARAGEAGAGFAVVADEVRALAQRSAHAAKETSGLIATSMSNAGAGVRASARLDELMKSIKSDTTKVVEEVGHMAAVSKEQSQGVGQINTAVLQMDKVTQSNASSAEETASAAEELSAQAEELRGAVDSLRSLITKSKTADAEGPGKKSEAPGLAAGATALAKEDRKPAQRSEKSSRASAKALSKADAKEFWAE